MRNPLKKLTPLISRKNPKPLAPRQKLFLKKRPARVYAIGDVHGCLDLLLNLEAQIIKDAANEKGPKLIVMLGDYVDRGPQSRQTIDHLLAPPPEGFERICLAGNHEQMMIAFLENPKNATAWLETGGRQALASYGLSPTIYARPKFNIKKLKYALASHIPLGHLRFLMDLPSLLVMPGFIFVHAGVRPKIPLHEQTDRDLLWIRNDFLGADVSDIIAGEYASPKRPCRVIHGHTPVKLPVLTNARIGIDTGACLTGNLTALKITAKGKLSFLSTK